MIKTFKDFKNKINENFLSDEQEHIINLLTSGDNSNIELGLMLEDSQKVDLSLFWNQTKKINNFFDDYSGTTSKTGLLRIFSREHISVYNDDNGIPIQSIYWYLFKFNKLEFLTITNSNYSTYLIEELNFKETFPNLKLLTLDKNNLDSIPLNFNENLIALSLKSNPLKSLKGLEKISKLSSLDLESVENCKELSPIKNLKDMTHLNLSYTSFKDLSPLKNLINLELLFLKDLDIEPNQFQYLVDLKILKVLDLDGINCLEQIPEHIVLEIINNPDLKIKNVGQIVYDKWRNLNPTCEIFY